MIIIIKANQLNNKFANKNVRTSCLHYRSCKYKCYNKKLIFQITIYIHVIFFQINYNNLINISNNNNNNKSKWKTIESIIYHPLNSRYILQGLMCIRKQTYMKKVCKQKITIAMCNFNHL